MTSPSGGSQYQQDVGAPGGPHGPKITSIFDFSAEALEQLAFWLEQRGLHIPVAQLLGFSQFTVQTAPIIGSNESTATAYPSFTDLATTGPVLTGLPNGSYVFWFGAQAKNTLGDAALMGININGTSPTNATSCSTNSTVYTQIERAYNATLSAGNNTVKAQYSAGISGGTSNFSLRYLYALKYANL